LSIKNVERASIRIGADMTIVQSDRALLDQMIQRVKLTCDSRVDDLVVAIEEVVEKKLPSTGIPRTTIIQKYLVAKGLSPSRLFEGEITVGELELRRKAARNVAQIELGILEVEFVCTPRS
jgi:hypothetical protein